MEDVTNNIDEDIKIAEDLKNKWELNAFGDMSNVLSLNEIKAIENLLSRLKTAERMNDVLADELDIITDKIAMKIGTDDFEFCDERCHNEDECGECKQCIKEWARKKVEDEEHV